jgi:hypothetical protein
MRTGEDEPPHPREELPCWGASAGNTRFSNPRATPDRFDPGTGFRAEPAIYAHICAHLPSPFRVAERSRDRAATPRGSESHCAWLERRRLDPTAARFQVRFARRPQ